MIEPDSFVSGYLTLDWMRVCTAAPNMLCSCMLLTGTTFKCVLSCQPSVLVILHVISVFSVVITVVAVSLH